MVSRQVILDYSCSAVLFPKYVVRLFIIDHGCRGILVVGHYKTQSTHNLLCHERDSDTIVNVSTHVSRLSPQCRVIGSLNKRFNWIYLFIEYIL